MQLTTLHVVLLLKVWVGQRLWLHGTQPAVSAGALNFKDVMLAYGKLNRDMMSNGYVGCKLGFEFSGMLNNRRIMGVAKQAIATHVFARDYLVEPSPCVIYTWAVTA